jgi:hypothetical protein
MPAQTPDTGSRYDNVVGSLRCVNATFASVTASDTWKTGLGIITNCQATCGNAAAELTFSGSTVTFTNSGTNYNVRAVGF